MSYADKLTAEINRILDDLAERGESWEAKWIAHGICNSHSDGLNSSEDAEFWRWCGYTETRDQVRRCINSRAGDKAETNDRQYRLPGYDHLQSYYVVQRGGVDVGVPVTSLSDAEIEEKSSLFRSMGAACYAHADELDRFRRLRRTAAAK